MSSHGSPALPESHHTNMDETTRIEIFSAKEAKCTNLKKLFLELLDESSGGQVPMEVHPNLQKKGLEPGDGVKSATPQNGEEVLVSDAASWKKFCKALGSGSAFPLTLLIVKHAGELKKEVQRDKLKAETTNAKKLFSEQLEELAPAVPTLAVGVPSLVAGGDHLLIAMRK